jgi:hypothetical protein
MSLDVGLCGICKARNLWVLLIQENQKLDLEMLHLENFVTDSGCGSVVEHWPSMHKTWV